MSITLTPAQSAILEDLLVPVKGGLFKEPKTGVKYTSEEWDEKIENGEWYFTHDPFALKRREMEALTIRLPYPDAKLIRGFSKENHISIARLIRLACRGEMAKYFDSVRFISQEEHDEIFNLLRKLVDVLGDISSEQKRIGVNFNQIAKKLNACSSLDEKSYSFYFNRMEEMEKEREALDEKFYKTMEQVADLNAYLRR